MPILIVFWDAKGMMDGMSRLCLKLWRVGWFTHSRVEAVQGVTDVQGKAM